MYPERTRKREFHAAPLSASRYVLHTLQLLSLRDRVKMGVSFCSFGVFITIIIVVAVTDRGRCFTTFDLSWALAIFSSINSRSDHYWLPARLFHRLAFWCDTRPARGRHYKAITQVVYYFTAERKQRSLPKADCYNNNIVNINFPISRSWTTRFRSWQRRLCVCRSNYQPFPVNSRKCKPCCRSNSAAMRRVPVTKTAVIT